MALIVVLTVLLSTAAGFGGAYIAKLIWAPDDIISTRSDSASLSSRRERTPAKSDSDSSRADGGDLDGNNNDDSYGSNSSVSSNGNTDSNENADNRSNDYNNGADSNDGDNNSNNDTSAGSPSVITSDYIHTGNQKKASGEALSIPEIAALSSDSVVEIYTESVTSNWRMGQFVTEGAGSGVVITANGYIATNNHVIDGASKITVLLKDGSEFDATLVGRDAKTDLAVIKIDAEKLQPAVYGDSNKLVVGELAVAIGNPLGQLGGTVSEGIISALSRSIDIDGEMMSLLQTTAAVNPGNSGGGLFNAYGELIGVVNAKSSGSDIEGIGFAIPANTVKTIVEAIIKNGYVPGRIDFGVTLIDIPDARTAMMYRVQSIGVYVAQTDESSSLRAGDRIISVNKKEITSAEDVKAIVDAGKVGDVLSITVVRNGQSIAVSYTLKQAT